MCIIPYSISSAALCCGEARSRVCPRRIALTICKYTQKFIIVVCKWEILERLTDYDAPGVVHYATVKKNEDDLCEQNGVISRSYY